MLVIYEKLKKKTLKTQVVTYFRHGVSCFSNCHTFHNINLSSQFELTDEITVK